MNDSDFYEALGYTEFHMKKSRAAGILGRAIYMLLGSALTTLALLVTGEAHGATFRGDAASCANLSEFAGQVAELRDTGAPWDAFEGWLRMNLELARENPGSYIKDQDDVDFVLIAMKRVYDNPQMTPEQATAITNVDCMKKLAKSA